MTQQLPLVFTSARDNSSSQRIDDTLQAQMRQHAGRHKHPTACAPDGQSVKITLMSGVREL
jgi:hypothetical protein